MTNSRPARHSSAAGPAPNSSRDQSLLDGAEGRCGVCDGRLSRYNPSGICAACERASGGPAVDGPDLTVQLEHAAAAGASADAGRLLRAWRKANNRSQADVAALLGVTQQHLSLLENGRRPVSLEHRQRMIAELGITPEDLGLAGGTRRASDAEDVDVDVTMSRMRWRNERRWLNQHRAELARLAVQLYPQDVRVLDVPFIAPPGWQLERPLELGNLSLTLDERQAGVAVTGAEPDTAGVRPLRTSGERFERYTSAIRHLDPPRLYENRPTYRLLGGGPGSEMQFGMAGYFDKLDVTEAVAHELAVACMDGGVPRRATDLPGLLFRDLVGDPFEPTRRVISPAVTTLTIRLRRYPAEPTFLLHWRDAASVATTAGLYNVLPAGEFQPSSVGLWDRRADFDVWRNIVREYSEELLGTPEHDGSRTEPIRYEQWPLYDRLTRARQDGTAFAAVLGMGLDPLTLGATLLTVVVLDDDVFDGAFPEPVRRNDEGELVGHAGGVPSDGLPFTEECVHRLVRSEPLASPGAACLALTWKHRRQLGL